MDAPVALTPLAGPPPVTTRDEYRALFRLAAPLVGANLLQMAVYAIDVMFVARLSAIDFAASTLGVFLLSLIMWALIGFTGACAPLIAAELGARAHAVRQVRRSFRMAMWLGAISGAFGMIVLANGERILLALGQNPQVAARSGAFLTILLWVMLPNIWAGVMRTVAAALGRPGWAMLVTACAVGTNALGNWLLVFGHGGFPALGLEGSAIASLFTATAMMLAYVAIFAFDRRLRRYRLFGKWWVPHWRRMGEIAKLGAPIALTFTLEGGLFGGAAFLMGLIGVTEVAAHAIALNIAALSFQVPFGIAQAATIRVGMAYGARDLAWIGRAGWAAIVSGTGFMALTAAAIWLAPKLIVGIYVDVNDPTRTREIALALDYLVVAAAFQLFDGAQAVAAGSLRGLQDTRVPMVIAAFGYWVAGFGTAIFLGFRAGWQGVGIWVGLAVGLAVVSVLLVARWAMRDRLVLLPAPRDEK
ncbi:MAG: MATE family efflux transporter [Sphingomonas sp.]|uniref:MATE family efflux transporter n=1 Tax=Sphingomonas sp. TaxID=28214 RepID=UPI001AC88DBE|nr:MATE family efflux transporter [Sphingomonas sp.]MBN8808488.1 MATE family efflux transporter [Sphingomonas sp.]